MKNFTFVKSLLAASLAYFFVNMPVMAQNAEETPEVTTVYQMVEKVTSGNKYVIAIMSNEGKWYAANPPFGVFYPIIGRVFCQNAFEVNDDMQIIPGEYPLSTFTFIEEEGGTLILSQDDYLMVQAPFNDGKGDDKDDGKDPVNEYTFVLDKQLSGDCYWDVKYDAMVGGFTLNNISTGAELGVDYDMMTNGEGEDMTVSYIYRIVPYLTLPEELKTPIYLFELTEATTGVNAVESESSNTPKEVYNLSGMMVGKTTEGLNSGIYIVKQGKSVKKVVVE